MNGLVNESILRYAQSVKVLIGISQNGRGLNVATKGTIERPMTIELTPNGKTLIVVYPSTIQGEWL